MDNQTFESFRRIIYRESGIVLTPEKLPLLSNRIRKRLAEFDGISETEYLRIIEVDETGAELSNLIDAISTNVTFFYREDDHFRIFREFVAERVQSGHASTKVWCAAASSGEEPYTLAFEGLEAINGRQHDFRILATDICVKVLERALTGRYSDASVSKIPAAVRAKYFECDDRDDSTPWIVKGFARDRVLYKRLNLVSFPYPVRGPIDIIFCRNVMIYFDRETRAKIVDEFRKILAPGGTLFLSHSENLLGIEQGLEKIGPSVYRRSR